MKQLNKSTFLVLLSILLSGLKPAFGQCGLAGFNYGTVGATNGTGFLTLPNFSPGTYFTWSVLNGGSYAVSTCGAAIDSQLSVYNNGLGFMVYNDDNGALCLGGSASLDNIVPNFSAYMYVQVSEYYCQPGGSSSINVFIRQNNNLSFTSSSAPMCSGQTRVLSATPAPVGSSQPGAGNLGTFSGVGVSGNVFTAPNVAVPTNYTITYTFGYVSQTQVITVNPNPVVTITGITPLCYGSTFTLTANGANTYLWNTGSTAISINGSPTVTTSYSVTGTSSAGCSDTDTFVLNVNPNPSVAVTSSTPAVCFGNTLNLTGTSIGSSISWYTVSTGGTAIGTSPSAANFSLNPSVTQTYYSDSRTFPTHTQVFGYTGAVQNFIVPAGVTTLSLSAKGAQGASVGDTGGYGSLATGVLTVTPGQSISIFVGGAGTNTTGGFNGGGDGGTGSSSQSGGGGGGATDFRTGGAALANRVLIGAGGGGSGSNVINSQTEGGNGGAGTSCASPLGIGGAGGNGCVLGGNGGCAGGTAANYGSGGAGGGLNIGGGVAGGLTLGSYGEAGSLGQGGEGGGAANAFGGVGSGIYGAGGGGGGLYGGSGGMSGNGGCHGGGGGGSSFAASNITSPAFASGASYIGNGSASITFTASTGCVSATRTAITITVNAIPSLTATASSSVICLNNTVTLTGSGASTYTWTGGVTNAVAFSPTATASYTLTGTSAAGCNNTISPVQTITVNPLPTLTISATNNTICNGFTSTLTATGANTYTWTSGPSTASFAVTPSITTTYTTTGTDVNSCVNTKTFQLTVNPLPTVTAVASDTFICINTPVTVTGGGASTYTLTSSSPGSYTSGVAFTPTTTASYSIVGTSAAGCLGTNTAIQSITVNALPTVTAIVTNTFICLNNTISLNSSGANTYTWTSSAGGSYTNGISFSPTVTANYSVVGTSTAGCTNTNVAALTVTVNPLPTLTATATNTFICLNSTVSLNSTGANTYTWSSSAGGSYTNGVSFSPTITASYSVVGTSTANCPSSNTAVVTITVNSIPVVSASTSTSQVCFGNTVVFNGAGAGTYTWTGGVIDNTPFTPTATGSYSVVGTSTAGCISSNTAVASVTVIALPTVTASTTSSTICLGQTVTLSGSGANTYTWTPAITNGVAFSPTSTVLYSLAGTSTAGCTSTNSAVQTVTVNPLPLVTASASNTFICLNNTVTLNGGGASTYTWTSAVGSYTNGVAFTPTATASYSVSGTSVFGCLSSNTAVVTITVNPLPVVSAATSTSQLCFGNTVTFNGSGASTYTWTGGVIDNTPFTPTATGSYSVVGTSTAGCVSSNTAVVSVTVIALPTVTASATSSAICLGQTVTLTGSGANTYTWTGGVTNGVAFSPTSTVTYSLTGTSAAGCTSTNSAIQTVTVNPIPVVTANTSTTAVCAGNSITLTGGGASTYTWTSPVASVTNNVAFSPTATASYSVVGTSAAGCVSSNTAVTSVTVIALPIVGASISSPTVCATNSVTVTGSGANTYVWTGGVLNNVPFSPAANASYSVTGTATTGCTSTNVAVVSVTVHARPTITANATSTTICLGNNITLTGSGANTYTWTSGVTNGNAFSPTVGVSSYSVIGTSSLGCLSINTATISILTNPLPTVTAAASNTVICLNTTITLNGGGANTYTWIAPAGTVTNNVAFSPTSTAIYSVVGTSTAGCISSNTAVISVTVNPLPVVTANASNSVICFGGNTTLNGGGANTYTWSNSVTNNVAFSPTVTNNYTVTGTGANGCVNSTTITVTVNPLPIVSGTISSPIICFGGTASLNASGANTYTWTSITGTVPNIAAFSPTANNTYSLVGTSTAGCTSTNSVIQSVTVNPLPVVAGTAPNPVICLNGTTALNASGANTYTWASVGGTLANATAFSPTATANYTLTGTSIAGCTSTNNPVVTITVNSLPNVLANSTSSAICLGFSTNVFGSGAVTYTWAAPAGTVTNNVAFSPTATAVYSVSGTDANGCINSATTSVAVNPNPTVNASVSNSVICFGGSVALIGGGASTYTWSNGVGNNTAFSPTSTASYSVTGSNSFGCVSVNTAVVSVTVNALPNVTASSSNSVICFGGTTTVNGGGASTYTWSAGLTNASSFSPTSTLVYTVTGSDANSCQNTATTTVIVNALPVLTVSSTFTLCAGEQATLTASGANTYTWSNSIGGSTIAVSPTITTPYTVTATDINGCSNSAVFTQSVFNCSASLSATAYPYPVTCRGKNDGIITIKPTVPYAKNKVSYIWDQGVCPTNTCDSVTRLKAGIYRISMVVNYTIGTNFSKADTVVLNPVTILDVNPSCDVEIFTGITPNGDGINDSWLIKDIELYLKNRVTIFNRWGVKLAEISGYDNNSKVWPSPSEMKNLTSGTYYYVIELGDGTSPIKGWVEILKD